MIPNIPSLSAHELIKHYGPEVQSSVNGVLVKLQKYVDEGEIWIDPKTLILHVFVTVVTVRHVTSSGVFELYEDHVIEPDGTVIERHKHFDGSLSEKIKTAKKETPEQAGIRGIREELGQTEKRLWDVDVVLDWHFNGVPKLDRPWDRFAHFNAIYYRNLFMFHMPMHFVHEEYHCEDDGRHIFFKWHKVTAMTA